MTNIKAGWKTTEFWVTVLAGLGLLVTKLSTSLPASYTYIALAVAAGAYAVSRGISKFNASALFLKAGYKTTEFYVTLAALVGTVATALAGAGLSPKIGAVCVTISGVAYATSRSISKFLAFWADATSIWGAVQKDDRAAIPAELSDAEKQAQGVAQNFEPVVKPLLESRLKKNA